MNKSIYQVLSERKSQFEQFLLQSLPPNKHTFVTELQSKTVEEFVYYIQTYIIPNRNNIDNIIDIILTKTTITKSEITPENMKKFKLYLELFVEFVMNI